MQVGWRRVVRRTDGAGIAGGRMQVGRVQIVTLVGRQTDAGRTDTEESCHVARGQTDGCR